MVTEPVTAQRAIQQAHHALREGDRETARRLAEQAAQLAPDLEDPWLILAAISNPQESVDCLKRALQINPSSLRAREGMHWAVQRLRAQQLATPSTSQTVAPREAVESPIPSKMKVETAAQAPSLRQGRSEDVLGRPTSTLRRVFLYSIGKAITLFITVAIGLYLTILVINLGGYVDQVFSAYIDEAIGGMIQGGWLKDTPEPERTQIIDQTRWEMQESAGLHQPFMIRTFRWLVSGMTLDLGQAYVQHFYSSQSGSVREIILSRLPYTLVLIGVANVLVFISSILVALFLSRQHGSVTDRLFNFLAPVTSAPSWIIGIILVAIFAAWLGILPYPRVIRIEGMEYSLKYFMMVGRQMILPIMAIFIGAFFQGVYTWRTYFLIYANEDYVEMARANGLPARLIERRHILRPVMPYVITSFATTMILLWQGSFALELLFYWPGVGLLFLNSIRSFNNPVSLGVVVTFAYLLAITVFLLEITYALVDPRVRLSNQGLSVRPARVQRKRKIFSRKIQTAAPWNNVSSTVVSTLNGSGFHLQLYLSEKKNSISRWFQSLKPTLRELFRYPSTIIGLVMIIVLLGLSIYTIVTIPYDRAVVLWRGQSGGNEQSDWYQNPQYAPPAWINFFRKEKLPETIVLNSKDGAVQKEVRSVSATSNEVKLPFTFEYNADTFPSDLVLFISTKYDEKAPFISLIWRTPDGREIDLGGHSSVSGSYYLSRDKRLERKFKGQPVLEGLFGDPNAETPTPLKGTYVLDVSGFTFDPGADVDTEVVIYGSVHGLAGTDHQRRDLAVGLLLGMPLALIFGILGAIGTSLFAMTIAAIGVWYSGWVDDLVQRTTEVSMILPALPIVMMVYLLFSKSIWVILAVVVILNIFGGAIKNYRAAFLQIKDSPYIEAARTYGTSNWHMIRHYLVPHIMPVLIPQIVIMIPVFVFYEATLAFLGVMDPYIPTWGKIIYDALIVGDVQRYTYWFLEPTIMLLLTALAFTLFGLGLERILNPKLRVD